VARHRIETAGKAVRLIIEEENLLAQNPQKTQNNPLKADGMSLKYLTIRAVDKRGNTVPSFDEPLTVSLEGTGATLLSLDNGDHYTSDLFGPEITTKRMYMGQMQVILRSTKKMGDVVLRATSPSLKAKLKFQTN